MQKNEEHIRVLFSFSKRKRAGDSTMEKCGGYQAGYGDGPIWHEAYEVIWLDRAFEKIITFNQETGQENIYDALGQIMAIIPTTDGQFIGIYKDGLYRLNFKQRFKSPLYSINRGMV